ncbi:uncharacterized protein LOC119171694 isoform X3 [Rhipicephalus microplus]|uniref:uncharacterized protein LOC119171694 isoform X3 n=1 Tax=Rhipicephalus microplus TaxID=6941 RepID=UPI003F6A7C4C
MKSFYFMSAVFIMAVSLAIRAEEVKANATAVEDRYRVTNSSTRDCRGHVFDKSQRGKSRNGAVHRK